MSSATKIFARKFKIKKFPSKFKTTTRQEEVIEFDNFFKFRFDWDPKYHFELFTLKHPENGDKYLVVYFYIVCPPLLVKNHKTFQLKLSTVDKHYEKCFSKEWTVKFDNNECKGWYTYLSFDDVVNKDNKILVDDKLTLCCEVKAISEET